MSSHLPAAGVYLLCLHTVTSISCVCVSVSVSVCSGETDGHVHSSSW